MNIPWQPITHDQLLALIKEELAELSDALKIRFADVHTPLYTIKCQRNLSSIIEEIFVVGRYENYVIIFDDVEDEFAIAELTSEGKPITHWSLSWNLMATLQNLEKRISIGKNVITDTLI